MKLTSLPMMETLKNIVETILTKAGITFTDVVVTEEDGRYLINIESQEDSSTLIGWHGETLFALQSIVKNLAQKETEEAVDITLDVEDYRKKREQNILEMAQKKAERVQETQEEEFMPPMHPYYRKRVHEFLAENEQFSNLGTESVGEGKDRQLKIVYKG